MQFLHEGRCAFVCVHSADRCVESDELEPDKGEDRSGQHTFSCDLLLKSLFIFSFFSFLCCARGLQSSADPKLIYPQENNAEIVSNFHTHYALSLANLLKLLALCAEVWT